MNINVTFARKPCGNEYLRFHDGDSEGSDRITEYTCDSGQVIGDYLYSSGRSLWLEVKTAVTANSTSIHLLYQAQDKQGKILRLQSDPSQPCETLQYNLGVTKGCKLIVFKKPKVIHIKGVPEVD